jgi:hypothetical protein
MGSSSSFSSTFFSSLFLAVHPERSFERRFNVIAQSMTSGTPWRLASGPKLAMMKVTRSPRWQAQGSPMVVCAENLDSDVSVMKSAENWLRMQTTDSLSSP